MYISQYHLNYNTVTVKKSEYCWKWCKASINLTNPTYVEGWEKFENTKGGNQKPYIQGEQTLQSPRQKDENNNNKFIQNTTAEN